MIAIVKSLRRTGVEGAVTGDRARVGPGFGLRVHIRYLGDGLYGVLSVEEQKQQPNQKRARS
ncbi:hypothetical protein, partial [Pseudomonas sp. D6002]|uniref:hypothetical protein n=1 Tax=Pseudomonas sp. D6002 TaxID=2738819 RepID=UPI001C434E65